MKLLTSLIYRAVIFLTILLPVRVSSQTSHNSFTLLAGIYDFTDETSKEFYHVVPSAILAYHFYQKTHFSLKISSGLSFTRVKYNEKYHTLYLLPLNLIAIYMFTEPDTRIRPFLGTGVCLHFKSDKNEWMDQAHYTLTYGYSLNAGFDFPVRDKFILTGEINYLLLMPSLNESLSMRGVLTLIGIKIPIKKD